MEDTGEKLTGDLVHIRNHQQQALGRRIGGREGACVQASVYSAGSTGLCLHFLHFDSGAENVLSSGGGPLINIVSHRAGRGDRVNCGYFRECIGYVGGCIVAVHGLKVTHNHTLLLISIKNFVFAAL